LKIGAIKKLHEKLRENIGPILGLSFVDIFERDIAEFIEWKVVELLRLECCLCFSIWAYPVQYRNIDCHELLMRHCPSEL